MWIGKGTELTFRCSYLESKTTIRVRRDTAHSLLIRGTIGVGTPHNIERKSLAMADGNL